MLLITAAFAQENRVDISAASKASFNKNKVAYTKNLNSSRAIVYYEGFETTTGTALPTGWTESHTGSAVPWFTLNDERGQMPGVVDDDPDETPSSMDIYAGERCLGRSWLNTGRAGWAFSNAISLFEGVEYTITFWFVAPGYPLFGEFDEFEVRIGQTATADAMSTAHLVFENKNTLITEWTQATGTFTPTSTETYHLGIHDLNVRVGGQGTGLYILIDEIEISGGAECNPASNLAVAYDEDCKEAVLTWTAPGEGEFTYQVSRDGFEIAIVETETYTDITYEASLSHRYSIKVICEEGTSTEIFVNKPACIPADCEGRPTKLTVDYSDDCDAATLKWNAFAELIHVNATPTDDEGFMNGFQGGRYLGYAPGFQHRDVFADDFTVPSGETWYVAEVSFVGFPIDDEELPDYFGVEIYEDGGNDLPAGDPIFENYFLIPESGNMSNYSHTVKLPELLEFSEGTYWISIYAVYDDVEGPTNAWVIALSTVGVGAFFAGLDEDESPEWEPATNSYDYKSMYFALNGSKYEIAYNVYRDGEPIKTGVTGISYIDEDFEPTEEHRWGVKMVCADGIGEGAAATVSEVKCKEPDDPGEEAINEPTTTYFSIVPNPAYDKITITSETNFSKIEVINFLGQTVISQPNTDNTLVVSNLNNGVYFVRITTDNGTSVKKFVKQ